MKNNIAIAIILACLASHSLSGQNLDGYSLILPSVPGYPDTPESGMLIYHDSTYGGPGFEYYNGSSWEPLGGGSTEIPFEIVDSSDGNSWVRVVEDPTSDHIDFVLEGVAAMSVEDANAGNVRLKIISPNGSMYIGEEAGIEATGEKNMFIGRRAGYSTTVGMHNTYVGLNAGYYNISGRRNTNLGLSAGLDGLGNDNTNVGFFAGVFAANGSRNIHIGPYAGELSEGSDNTAIGYRAGSKGESGAGRNVYLGSWAGEESNGWDNTFVGYQAGRQNDAGGDRSTHVGSYAGEKSDGNDNTFVGFRSGAENLGGGTENVAVGGYSLGLVGQTATSGGDGRRNTAFGYKSGESTRKGSNNLFGGYNSGRSNIGGDNNTFLGYESGRDNTEGVGNTNVGAFSGQVNGGTSNAFLGYESGRLAAGDNNTYLGAQSGRNNLGSNNVFIGSEAGWWTLNSPHFGGVSDRLVVSNDRTKVLLFGEFDNDRVGINTTDPAGALHIGGVGDDSKLMLNNGGDIWWENSSGTFESVLSVFTDDKTYLHGPEGLVMRTDGITRMHIDDSGDVFISDLVGTGTADVQVTSAGEIYRAASDIRLKEDIEDIPQALQSVLNLRGVSYYWKDRPHTDRTYGVIAQEVMEVLPDIVTSDGEYYGVNYSELPAILIEAIKEQQQIIEKLEKEQIRIEGSFQTKLDQVLAEFNSIKQEFTN